MPNQTNITKPILIVGAGRTASSYVLKMLSIMGHTQILNENDYVMALKKMVLEGYWLPYLLESQSINEVVPHLVDAVRNFIVSLFPSNKEYWAMKAIWEEVDWDWYQLVFPNAKYIHLVRDPRTNIPSMMEFIGNESGQSHWDFDYSCQKYVASNLKAFLLAEKGVPYLLVKQEDFVDHPQETWKEICNFLELPFVEVDFNEVNVSSSTRGKVSEKRKSNLLSWERLPPKVIEIAEQCGYYPLKQNFLGDAKEPESTHNQIESLIDLFEVFNPNLRRQIEQRKSEVERWSREGIFPEIQDKVILDWGCGDGAFSFVFVEKGVKKVLGIDSWLADYQNESRVEGVLEFKKMGIQNVDLLNLKYDLMFANTITEHLKNLPELFIKCYKIINDQGYLFINHDNYYQPTGAHDHGFLFYGENNQIVFQGVACWQNELKCEVSKDHRDQMAKIFWWTWSGEEVLTPDDCTKCPYYKRSQPWAHLIYQEEFCKVYDKESFTTGYPNSSLNKITPFQLRQFIIEAGFTIVKEVRNRVSNLPPDFLLCPPYNFSLQDLTTSTITILAKKKEEK